MEKDSITAMELCLDNWLKINPIKTELMYIASQWLIKKCVENSKRVGMDMVERPALIKLLGTWLDEHLSFEYHITQSARMPC